MNNHYMNIVHIRTSITNDSTGLVELSTNQKIIKLRFFNTKIFPIVEYEPLKLKLLDVDNGFL